jgi:integrase/recombinase XerD
MLTITFENYLIKRGYTKLTIKSYMFQSEPFIVAYPDMGTFTYKDVFHALHDHLKGVKSPNYKCLILSSIKKYYDYLLETGFRDDHPCRTMNFRSLRNPKVIHQNLFSSAELDLLLNRDERFPHLKLRNQVITSILIYQGIALQEFENLKIQHVDLEAGKIFIKETKSLTRRHLELHPKQYEIFDRYFKESRTQILKEHQTDGLVVTSRGKQAGKDDIFYIIETFKYLFPDRNLTPETIRQSVISNWLNEKRYPLEQVQLMAGHKWISSTVKYRQTNIDDRRAQMNRFHPLG